ncbi:hypothetical protein LX69_00760 [Breznakibacter xylanolyticus]|uniref:Lysylphosphatidylglycerol synthase-like protein n=1 Tax=Breznakibacter xylanolyticus TaxID=990 RepID=A0A2W7NJ80_9BACT|nr:lysylphosphatidylglycerol synthase transmembrane domain-containing protein [Breznakibacter xylanolyticus]MBN2743203.1 flippase-like domain-containing protein [Marinilabiliaceae bacterium]PZX19493.1 hypothetical protein LX69_00760 [Breznakibacter xylanolyticus]
MVDNSGKILNKVKPGRIIWPLLIGAGITVYLFRDIDFKAFSLLEITMASSVFLFLAFLLMVIRDFGYIWRLRLLSNGELSWQKCLSIVMLWEFTSAITPSAVGGTSVAIFFVNKEGVTLGRSSAIVLMTSLLDELYFVITFPLIILLIGGTGLFSFGDSDADIWYKSHFFIIALTGYSLKLIYSLIVFYGLFVNPRGLKWLLLMIFKLPIIRKWRPQARESGDDLIKASLEFRTWPFKNWLKAFLATAISWTARYWVVNALILFLFGYSYLNSTSHIMVFGKQFIMWIMMLITPTPGGSGFAEVIFKEFLNGNLPQGLETVVALLWRMVSYYPYLIIGAIVIPRWIKRHFVHLQ